MLKLEGCERELWAHYTQGVRHTCGDNTRMKNRPTSPVWEAITAAAMTRPPGEWKWQPRKPTESKDVTMLIKQAAGCLLSAINALGSVPWIDDKGFSSQQMQSAVIDMVVREMESK
jgi:hypothetical protein